MADDPTGTVHIVGAGLAGLSTALNLDARGVAVRVWDAAGHAGGRCRSYHDRVLGRLIDNGNHLVLSGNHAVKRYLDLVGAPHALREAPPLFPFVDLAAGERWTADLGHGPLSALMPRNRLPGTGLGEFLDFVRLARADPGLTVAEAVPGRGPLWERFWEPLTIAVLNAPPERADAGLLRQVLRETMLRGRAWSRPCFAPEGLGAAFIDPAVRSLGAKLRLGIRIRALQTDQSRVVGFETDRTVALGPRDALVLALPPGRLRALMPDLTLPRDGQPIANAHFVLPAPPLSAPPLLGVLGSLVQWIFVRGDVVSITISAADEVETGDREALLDKLWVETASALQTGQTPLARRLIVERRATFDQSPAGVALRPPAATVWPNLFLAGDATDTGLPATIEGAIRSGETAARLAAGVASG